MISNSRYIISTVCSNDTYFTNIHVLMIIFCEIDSNKALFPSSRGLGTSSFCKHGQNFKFHRFIFIISIKKSDLIEGDIKLKNGLKQFGC